MCSNAGGSGVCSVKWSRSGERRDFTEWNLSVGLEEADESADPQWLRARKEGGMGRLIGGHCYTWEQAFLGCYCMMQ